MDMTADNRLQISLWDHARLKANECRGAMSFALSELASSEADGWFELLPYKEGRTGYQAVDDSSMKRVRPPALGMVSRQTSLGSSSSSSAAPAPSGGQPQTHQRRPSAGDILVTSSGSTSPSSSPKSSMRRFGSREMLTDQGNGGATASLGGGGGGGGGSTLKRTNSQNSLVSVASAMIVSGEVKGMLNAELRYEPAPDDKTAGSIYVIIKECRGLGTKEPYVKLYLSKDGKDNKPTKQKTKSQKGTNNPIFQERFVFNLPRGTPMQTQGKQLKRQRQERPNQNYLGHNTDRNLIFICCCCCFC